VCDWGVEGERNVTDREMLRTMYTGSGGVWCASDGYVAKDIGCSCACKGVLSHMYVYA